MGLLNDIEALLPNQIDVWNLTDQELIRIEKQLKSQAKLDDSIDLNRIQVVLNMLKEHSAGLSVIYEKINVPLRMILKNPTQGYCVGVNTIRNLPAQPALEKLLADGFREDLKLYVGKCIKDNHYAGLYTLLQYSPYLAIDFLDQLNHILRQKINYIIEILRIQSSEKIAIRAEAVMNPFFYRCLNLLGPSIFTDQMRFLVNVAAAYQWDDDIKWRILFAMGSFRSVNEEFAEIIRHNHEAGYSRGIRELGYHSFHDKGGTFKRNAFDHRSYEESNRPKQKSESNDASGLRVVGLLLFLGFMAFKIWFSSSDHKYEAPDYNFLPMFEKLDLSSPVNLDFNMDADLEFVKAVNYIQSDSAFILSNQPVEFGQNLHAYFESDRLTPYEGKPDQVKVINNTEDDLILFFQGDLLYKKAFLFLEPENFEWISGDLAGFRIYTGDSPEMVEYREDTTQRKYIEGFRWGEFTDEHRKHFNVYHDLGLSLFPGEIVELEISFKGDSYTYEVDKTTHLEEIE